MNQDHFNKDDCMKGSGKTASKAPSDGMEAIRKYFTVETAPRQPRKWLVVCEKCGDMWHLDKQAKHPGNVLHLLNHARSH